MTASTVDQQQAQNESSDEARTPLPLRSDTLLGVCEAVSEELRINPLWLRVPFAGLLLWNPEVIIAAYLGLGCVVAVARMLFPPQRNPRLREEEQPVAMEAETVEERLAA